MATDVLVTVLLGALAAHLVAGAYVACAKRRSVREGLAFAFCLGPVGLLIVALLPTGERPPARFTGFFAPDPPPPAPPPAKPAGDADFPTAAAEPAPPKPAAAVAAEPPAPPVHSFLVRLNERDAPELRDRLAFAGFADAEVSTRNGGVELVLSRPGESAEAAAWELAQALGLAGFAVERVRRGRMSG